MKTPKELNGITEPTKIRSNPEIGHLFGDAVAETSCGMAHSCFEPVCGDSCDDVELLQPLLVAENHCPLGCPKGLGVRLAAMARKMSKPALSLPPQDAAAKPAAARRKAPPMMLLCASAMGGAASSSAHVQEPYIGTLPKFPPARRNDVGWNAQPWPMVGWPLPPAKHDWEKGFMVRCEMWEWNLPGESAQVTEKTAISPTASLFASWGQILDWWKGHEGLLCAHCWWVGLPCLDRWGDPVVEAEAQWSGYTFLTMKREVMDQMNLNIQLQPATTADRPPWPMSENPRDDDLDVHVGRHYEMEKPCRHRPQQEPGLMVGRLYLDGCLHCWFWWTAAGAPHGANKPAQQDLWSAHGGF